VSFAGGDGPVAPEGGAQCCRRRDYSAVRCPPWYAEVSGKVERHPIEFPCAAVENPDWGEPGIVTHQIQQNAASLTHRIGRQRAPSKAQLRAKVYAPCKRLARRI